MSNNSYLNLIVLLAAIASLIVVVATTNAGFVFAKQKFHATLSGSEEVPPVDTKAGGDATFTTMKNDTAINVQGQRNWII